MLPPNEYDCVTLEQWWEILQHYVENHGNVAKCMRKLRTDFKRRETTSAPYVRYLVKKVKETGILSDKPKGEKPKTVRTPENIAAVAESVSEAPSTSIHRRPQQLNISKTSLRRILHKDLGMTPYQVQLVQELKGIDYSMRFRFSKRRCVSQKMPILAKKIIFSGEAHFDIGGHVNKQNCRIWGTENPYAYIETTMHANGADFGPEA